MTEVKNHIENVLKKIEDLNEQLRQENNYLTFLRCWEEDQVEKSAIIADLKSKISSYELEFKSQETLFMKIEKERKELKIENERLEEVLIAKDEEHRKKLRRLKSQNRKQRINNHAVFDHTDSLRSGLSISFMEFY